MMRPVGGRLREVASFRRRRGGRKRRAFLAHIGEMCIFAPKKTTMNDIAAELAKLHVLKGADYSRQVERVARTVQAHWRVA